MGASRIITEFNQKGLWLGLLKLTSYIRNVLNVVLVLKCHRINKKKKSKKILWPWGDSNLRPLDGKNIVKMRRERIQGRQKKKRKGKK